MSWHDPARKLTDGERTLLEDLGYEVRENMHGGSVVRAPYHLNYVGCGQELAFVERAGEENVRALDALARLAGGGAGRAVRARFEAGDYSLDLPPGAQAARRR